MKIVALGDTHGRSYWKEIILKESFDILVFIGDYFDSKENISPDDQIQNFKEIIQYKENNKEKVILLIGNHDYHYLKNTNAKYAHFQKSHASIFQELLEEAIAENYLQMSFLYENLLFTHAGVTKTWAKNNSIDFNKIDNSINHLFHTNRLAFGFTPGLNGSNFGDDVTQTPIWVRPYSLAIDKIEGFVQVVGHTQKENVLLREHINMIDCLSKTKAYFIWENGIKSVGKME